MTVYDDHAAQLDALRQEQNDPSLVFVWSSANWLILPGGARFQRKNDIGGWALTSDLQLTCTTGQFGGTIPDSGDSMVYLGKEYTISAVTSAPGVRQIRINANLNVGGM